MEQILNTDRERLRKLAQKQLEYVYSQKNDKILQQWDALANGRKEEPFDR